MGIPQAKIQEIMTKRHIQEIKENVLKTNKYRNEIKQLKLKNQKLYMQCENKNTKQKVW